MIFMESLHPADLGDLPKFVQLGACAHLLPLDQKNVQSNWKTRYPDFLERRRLGGLWVNVKECDQWLDERGKKLLSTGLLEEKKRRNPGWAPAGDRLEALAGTQNEMIDKLAELVAQRLHANTTAFDGAAK